METMCAHLPLSVPPHVMLTPVLSPCYLGSAERVDPIAITSYFSIRTASTLMAAIPSPVLSRKRETLT